jgi:cytochrome d ubiquinol oxidase subunit II
LLALGMHGSLYLALKTEGDLEQRAFSQARKLWPAVLIVTLLSLPATVVARPNSLENYRSHPMAFLAPVVVVASLAIIFLALRRSAALMGFLGSCFYLFAMLAGAAAGLFPALLPSVGNDGQDVTISRALAGPHTLRVGLVWWSLGILLAVMYFSIVYWLFRGKVSQQEEGYGH